MNGKERYQMRHAAGQYWLLDMEQKPGKYKAPLALNETGAMILENFWEQGNPEAAAKALSEEYEIGMDEALADVTEFLGQLKRQGIAL